MRLGIVAVLGGICGLFAAVSAAADPVEVIGGSVQGTADMSRPPTATRVGFACGGDSSNCQLTTPGVNNVTGAATLNISNQIVVADGGTSGGLDDPLVSNYKVTLNASYQKLLINGSSRGFELFLRSTVVNGSPNFGPPPSGGVGACCLNFFSCVALNEADCSGLNGYYYGAGSTCAVINGSIQCPEPLQYSAQLNSSGVTFRIPDLGACCLGSACWIRPLNNCQSSGGVFQGLGSVCLPAGGCPDIPAESRIFAYEYTETVQSAFGNLSSVDFSRLNVFPPLIGPGEYTVGGFFTGDIDESAFAGSDSARYRLVLGDPTTGACCVGEFECQQLTPGECADRSGRFLGLGRSCSSFPCDSMGACCASNGTCTTTLAADCPTGSEFLGAGTSCGFSTCLGACCSSTGDCTVTLPQACLQSGGVFRGQGSTCTQFSCRGACCLATTGCTELSRMECLNRQGAWAGLDTSCFPFPGACAGACCSSTGQCSIVLESNCTSGVFRGIGTTCSTPCVGACCTPAGICSLTAPAGCTGPNTFRGEGVACAPTTCAGACCLPSGDCTSLDGAECAARSGLYRGLDTACAASTCLGACCSRQGDCTVVNVAQCAAASGVFRGVDTSCGPQTCPGACCSRAGDCTITSAAACGGSNGIYRGLDLPCEPLTCPGACCSTERLCTITSAASCAAGRGVYLGVDTVCAGEPCCCSPWDNGRFDLRSAQTSIITVDQHWRTVRRYAADDFWLCEGQIHEIRTIRGRMTTNALLPKALVIVWEQCDGVPTVPIAVAGLRGTRFEEPEPGLPQGDVVIAETGEVFEGTRIIEVRADFDKLYLRGGSYFVSLVGFSANLDPLDEFFWGTAGGLVVKGRPGLFANDDSVWVDSADICCGCTDFNFCIEGESCKTLFDTGGPIAAASPLLFPGVASLQNGTRTFDLSRAATKVALPPCQPVDVCYIEGWIWTNCDRAAIQTFDDDCHCPASTPGSPLVIADCVTAGGVTVADPTGIPVTLKRVQIVLDPAESALLFGNPAVNRNVWVSLVGLGDNRQNARAYFAAATRCDTSCMFFGPDCFRPAPFNVTTWRRNGIDGTSQPGFDHALLVAVREARRVIIGPPPPALVACPVDINGSGTVTVQDLFDFLAAYFAGCP